MAIETTYFTGTTAAANYAEVSAWLTANAAEYFDEITGTENVITCKIGGVNALTLNFTGASGTDCFVITTKNGKTYGGGSASQFGNYALRFGYKTDHGIMICNNKADKYQLSIIISKSNDGNIFFAVTTTVGNNSTNPDNFIRILDFEKSLDRTGAYNSTGESDPQKRHNIQGAIPAAMTALVPTVSDAGTYCDNVLFTPFTQYGNMCWGVIDVSGTKYVYNGVFALKE